MIGRGDDELQKVWKTHYIDILNTIKSTGSYKPPRPSHPIRRFLLCQSHTMDYIIDTNVKENSYYISPQTYKEVCTAYVTAFDECVSTRPKTAVLIRKQLKDLLAMYAHSCGSLKNLEPQRSIVQAM